MLRASRLPPWHYPCSPLRLRNVSLTSTDCFLPPVLPGPLLPVSSSHIKPHLIQLYISRPGAKNGKLAEQVHQYFFFITSIHSPNSINWLSFSLSLTLNIPFLDKWYSILIFLSLSDTFSWKGLLLTSNTYSTDDSQLTILLNAITIVLKNVQCLVSLFSFPLFMFQFWNILLC